MFLETGDPVPVNPKDVKAVWEFLEREEREHGRNHMVGFALLQHACRLGADSASVFHRTMMLRMWLEAHPETQVTDAVFYAIAKVPIKCVMQGQRRTSSFDDAEFLRLSEEHDKSTKH